MWALEAEEVVFSENQRYYKTRMTRQQVGKEKSNDVFFFEKAKFIKYHSQYKE